MAQARDNLDTGLVARFGMGIWLQAVKMERNPAQWFCPIYLCQMFPHRGQLQAACPANQGIDWTRRRVDSAMGTRGFGVAAQAARSEDGVHVCRQHGRAAES